MKDGWLLFKNGLCILIGLYMMSVTHKGGNRGINAALEKLKWHFHWPKTWRDVYEYVRHCPICEKVKAPWGNQQGFLMPLPIEEASMDLVTNLPPSSNASYKMLNHYGSVH